MAIDSNDNPHIAYYRAQAPSSDGGLKYAQWTGTAWNLTMIHDDQIILPGKHVSIALDSLGHPHIFYGTWYHSEFWYIHWNGTDWLKSKMGNHGEHFSIIIDSSDNVHVSYTDGANVEGYSSSRLHYLTNKGGSFVGQDIADAGGGTYIDIDSNGNPAIAYNYLQPDTLTPNKSPAYVKWDGSKWEYHNISDDGSTDDLSLALDSNNEPHISYTNENGEIKYATFNGDIWTIGIVASSGGHSSIDLDNTGSPHISYQWGETKYAKIRDATPPSEPQNLLASAGDIYVNLTWSTPSDDGRSSISNYKIYRGTTSNAETLLATIDNMLYYNDTSIINDQTYYYKVSAVNDIGDGILSSEATATPSTSTDPLDSDQDGLPDTWEIEHFGDLTQSGSDDFDNDGYSNLQEYEAGTGPTTSNNNDVNNDSSNATNDGGEETPGFGFWSILIATTLSFIILTLSKNKMKKYRGKEE